MPETTIVREVKIAGQPFVLRNSDVIRALRNVDPEPITSHFVVVDARRFPPKQVVSQVTGLDRADFTTHQARRTLIRLGFPAGRRDVPTTNPPHSKGRGHSNPARDHLTDRLRTLSGQWVAIKPWFPAFGLLGLTGFCDRFEVTIAAYEEWIELTPINE